MQLGNGKWESTVFNSRLQPTQIALGGTPSATNLLKLNFDYGTTNNNGNVLSQMITVPSETRSNTTYAAFTATQTYSYDSLNRLKSAEETIPAQTGWKQTFTYDRFGNRNFDTANGNTTTIPANCLTAVCNPTVDPATNKLIGYVFDNAGNTKTDAGGQTFIYDAENKQVQVSNSNGIVGQYYYDGDGKRVKKVVPTTGETTVFVYDAGGKLVAEYANQIAATPQVSYLTSDSLGSPRINTDANGVVISRHDYQPFGEEIARPSYGADAVRKQFTAYERDDETGLDFAQARYFNSKTGRFLVPDNFLNDTDVSDPQSWNLYSYVRNHPLLYVDPNGKTLWIHTGNISVQYVRTDNGFKFVDSDGNDYKPENGSTLARVEGFLATSSPDRLVDSQNRNHITVIASTDGNTSSEVHQIGLENNIVQVQVELNGPPSADGIIRTQESTGLKVVAVDGTAVISNDNSASDYAFNATISAASNLLDSYFIRYPSNFSEVTRATLLERLADRSDLENGSSSNEFRGSSIGRGLSDAADQNNIPRVSPPPPPPPPPHR